jgi:hypothetical protein
MARKKKSSRKKTNNESLRSNVAETTEKSESRETVEESPQNSEVNPPATEESTQSSQPARPPATEETTKSTSDSAPANPPTAEEKEPDESTQPSALARPPARENKPDESTQPSAPAKEKKPYLVIKPKPIPAKSVEKKPSPPPVTEATNEAGELFHKGDSITVKAPWGGEATAEIVDFYQTHSGKIWAQYNPLDSQPNWTWHSGCIRSNLLAKATQTAQE